MDTIPYKIIALGWLANLFVSLWISVMAKTKTWITAKPFSCQMCMGFYIGLGYGIIMNENLIISACLTSFASTLLYVTIDKLGRC